MDDSGNMHNMDREKISKPVAIGLTLLKKKYIQAWFTWIGWCITTGALIAASIYLDGELAFISGSAACVSLLFVYLSALAAFQRLLLSRPKTRIGKSVIFIISLLFGRTGPIVIGILILSIVFYGIRPYI